ncbi:MAG: Stp1/IreP family PP2C-type Ser/Thr phosphatase [Ktedonobacterales bacterium]
MMGGVQEPQPQGLTGISSGGGTVLAKKLRLAVAGLTDVGRRRERNQDNVTHYVPTDERLLEEKGALFVVCDGMGGHAAGEVAAEFGVNTIRDAYYSSPEPDIIRRFAHAVKQANQAIFGYAREHPEMTGMGTTCVALVVHGGRAYFVNIGDSRAYLIRDGMMRQVTFDHSWVAEQVRAGVLTEEQARTHAHRNVITRSLGTQPTVSADLFVETLQDGDRVLLCSDGLHGYVEENAIEHEMAQHQHPEAGARNLVDMANANGGPDNITALVVHMLEVPEVAGEVLIPVPGEDEEQTITQPLPAMARSAPSRSVKETTSPANTRQQDLERHSAAVATVVAPRKRSAGGRVAVAAVRLLALVAVVSVAVGIWYVGFGPYAAARAATQRLNSDVTAAQQAIQQAPSRDPAQALTALAQAQQRLQTDLQDQQADAVSRDRAQQVLDEQISPAVRDTIQRYNAAAQITPLPSAGVVTHNVSCIAPDGTPATQLSNLTAFTAVAMPVSKPGAPPPASQTLYALNGGVIYRLEMPLDGTGAVGPGPATCAALPLAGDVAATTVALAADGSALFALVEKSGGAYAVLAVPTDSINANGTYHVKPQQRVTVATPHGETPKLLAVQGSTTYIGYTSTSGASGIWTFTDDGAKGPKLTAALTQPTTSLAATNNTLYVLLSDGSVGQLDPKSAYLPLPVVALAPVAFDAPIDYTNATPVPTAAAATQAGTNTTTGGGTLFPTGAVLAADPAVHTHIFVGDGTSHRAIRFTGNAAAPGLTLANQYVYGTYYSDTKLLALSSNGTVLNSFVWTGARLLTFTVDEPTPHA